MLICGNAININQKQKVRLKLTALFLSLLEQEN